MPKSKAQPKKEQPKDRHALWIIGLIAIVVIIAIVFVSTRPQTVITESTTEMDKTAFAGQAIING